MTDADFTRFLVDRGSTVAGSAATIEDLKRQYGVRRWFDFEDVVHLPPASLFPEQTEPFLVVDNRNCLLPPNEIECDFDYYRDGHRTHACALDRLTALFGTPQKGIAVNTLSETWTFQRMSLSIRTFLKEKESGRSPLYEKNPELWNFCRISIDRNWIAPMTEADARAINSRDILPIDRSMWRNRDWLYRWERGLFRLTNGTTPPFLWKQNTHVGWCAGPWSAIFDRSACESLKLDQTLPGRTAGHSELILRLHNPFSLEREIVDTLLLSGKDPNTLDRVAPAVSAFWDLPLKVEEFPDY